MKEEQKRDEIFHDCLNLYLNFLQSSIKTIIQMDFDKIGIFRA